MHVTQMETIHKYLGILPTIKNSPLVVASTEFGNVPFAEATHASIILSHLPVAWRSQYDLTHKTVPESPCMMLLDLKNIEKLFVNRYRYSASLGGPLCDAYNPTLRILSRPCLHTTSDNDQTRRKHTTQRPNKHHHHGDGAANPSGGVDLMNPGRLRGGRPCA